MGIRVQPKDILIPKSDPFRNDLLGRREPAQILANLLRSIEGPCVLAIDAAWGTGKTTFLHMLSQHLRNNDFRVIDFNAWETDFTNDPFLALSQELNHELREHTSNSIRGKLDDVKNATKEVIRRALPGAIRLATAGILDVSPLAEKEAGQVLASYAQARLDHYVDTRQSLQTFRTSLEQLAKDLAATNNNLPLVVVIDELDRCRPSYAVELLETAKHLFTTDYVAFVLAVNRRQLAHSVRAVYGAEFDSPGYLRRFFDIDFPLPEAKRSGFIVATLAATGIEDYFRKRSEHDGYDTVRDWLVGFFEAFRVNFRSIAQAIHHLGLVFASLRHDRRSFTVAATFALILRTVDHEVYRGFMSGELGDSDVKKCLLARASTSIPEIACYVEGVIIAAGVEVREINGRNTGAKPSPLLAEHREAAENGESESARYSQAVVETVDRFAPRPWQGDPGLGFREAVRRLELVSNSLVGDDQP